MKPERVEVIILKREIRKHRRASKERHELYQESSMSFTAEELQALIEECQALAAATQAECQYLESLVP